MISKDTIKLLRECDSGIKMGIASIEDVLGFTKSETLKDILEKSRKEHIELGFELENLLREYNDDGKDPGAIVKGMSWFKTNVKLAMNESDSTVADLITDGCNMGIKTLNRYLNEYEAANEKAKDLCKNIIKIEERLLEDCHSYL